MKYFVLSLLLIMSQSVFAATVARVIEVKGNAFTFTNNQNPKSLSYGNKISDFSEVMVEDGSTLSLINKKGHIIHVNGGSLVKFFKGVAEVKSGQVWVVAKGSLGRGEFHTSNSIANYGEGQFILSFDNVTGKSQLLVITGDVKYSNALEPELKIVVSAGHFSKVEQEFENGLPRTPTKVGLASYKSFKNLFSDFDSLRDSKLDKLWEEPKAPKRSIASVDDQFSRSFAKPTKKAKTVSSAKSGKLIKITTYGGNRVPASTGAAEYYFDMKKAEAARKRALKNKKDIPFYFYGFGVQNKKETSSYKSSAKVIEMSTAKTTPTKRTTIKTNEVNRLPASIQKNILIDELKNSPMTDFERSYMQNKKEVPRHSSEVKSLIDDLKSYKQDYKKEY